MPRKIRELAEDLRKAGFVDRGGKGSHRNFVHPKAIRVTLSGHDGDKHYQERAIKHAIEASKSL